MAYTEGNQDHEHCGAGFRGRDGCVSRIGRFRFFKAYRLDPFGLSIPKVLFMTAEPKMKMVSDTAETTEQRADDTGAAPAVFDAAAGSEPGRQGDAGMSRFFVSLEDEVVKNMYPDSVEKYAAGKRRISRRRLRSLINGAQKLNEEFAETA